jgi:hypothetical protein
MFFTTGPAVLISSKNWVGISMILTLLQDGGRTQDAWQPLVMFGRGGRTRGSRDLGNVGERLKYERGIPTPMAKGGKGTKGSKDRGSKGTRSTKSSSTKEEVTFKQAFSLSFLMFSVILAPVLGLGLYFVRNAEFLTNIFASREDVFLGGMAIGVALAFVVSIIFTRRALAHS